MTRYGVDACTECGVMSELLLAPRFPHICSRCLFPLAKPEDPRADFIEPLLAVSLMERLQQARGNGRWLGNVEAYGKSLPESYNRGKRE